MLAVHLGVAETKSEYDEYGGEEVEGGVRWEPGEAAEEASDEDGEGREKEETKRSHRR